MLKMVDGTGIIGVDMICPLGVSTPQPPNYDRVEMEGTGMLVLPNSLNAPLERLELGGKTEQVTTTGKNLFDIATCPLEHDGVHFKIPKSGGNVVLMGDFEENTQYTLSVQKTTSENANSAVFKFDYTDGTRDEINVKDLAKKSLTSNSAKNVKQFVLVNPYGGAHEVSGLQIEKGSTATSYEPYTGGKPSPSPEYPQEIKSVGKWNESTQKYEIEVVLSGKNLLDITACEDGKALDSYGNIINSANGFLTDFIPCFANSPYCRSNKSFTIISFYDRDKNFIGCINQYNDEFITPDECRYFRFSINKQDVDYTKAVANVGTALMDYEPYKKPQSLTLTSDRPITKWDRLVEQGGQIGWLYSTGVYEDIKESDISANGINDQYGRYYVNAIKAYKNAECMCNIAEYSPAQKENKCGFWWSDTLCFLISSEYTGNNGTEDNSTAIKNFKDNVLSKGITVFYKLNTEEFIPLPQSEQNAIRALETYYPTTVITADGGELDPDIKVTYRKEI